MLTISVKSCRVCLSMKNVENEIWRSIDEFDDKETNVTIFQKIQAISGSMSNTEIDLAKFICQHCLTNLKIAYNFQTVCRNSEKEILRYLENNKNSLQLQQIKSFQINRKKENKKKISSLNENFTQDNIKEIVSIDNAFPEIKVEVLGSGFESDKDSNNDANSFYGKHESDDDTTQGSEETNYPVMTRQIKNDSNLNGTINQDTVHKYVTSSAQEKIFVCELCGNVYKKRALLTDHKRWHTGSKDFKCEICGKEFLLNTYLARHIRTHTGIRNYKCSYCSRTFYTNGLKRAHEKVHTGERSYKCELCERSFSYSQSLQRHMLVHSGVKPHKCEDCGKEFRQESHLKQHMATNIHQAKQSLTKIPKPHSNSSKYSAEFSETNYSYID